MQEAGMCCFILCCRFRRSQNSKNDLSCQNKTDFMKCYLNRISNHMWNLLKIIGFQSDMHTNLDWQSEQGFVIQISLFMITIIIKWKQTSHIPFENDYTQSYI